jgi:hypothetical protein
MDCERIAVESPPGGPASWELSERAIRGYCTRLLDRGYPPTLFVVPECAQQHADLLGQLAKRGVELGLHVHPQSLGDHRYQRYLGEYDAEMQREILGLAAEMLERATGARPVSFRPGNFSASDATYGLLYDLGFRQGSVSDPGRCSPQYAAVWEGAYPDPHHVDPADKLRVGELPFLEVPLTTDPERRRPSGFPHELRIESGPFETWHRPIIRKHMRRLAKAAPGAGAPLAEIHALCIFTHNYHAYDRDDDSKSTTLQEMLDYLDGLARDREVIPVTLQEMHAKTAGCDSAGLR